MISSSEIRIGIVAEQGLDIWSTLTCLKQSGCLEENIVVKYVPSFQLAIGALFFAEYTDVDCTIVIGRNYNAEIASALINLQLQWNMPIDYAVNPVVDCQAVIKMVQLQSTMAQEAPTDRKNQLS